ncbi:hypothetical protein [Virgibacillus byunsanensis]|uniref:hypothetical protein n=1 Tax=Virgibacillus byunsanensis TaxID=570945 RepID=UPI0036F32625
MLLVESDDKAAISAARSTGQAVAASHTIGHKSMHPSKLLIMMLMLFLLNERVSSPSSRVE